MKNIYNYNDFLFENYNERIINKYIPYITDKYNIKIVKVFNKEDGIGIAYLTEDNKILKLTPSENEFNISLSLLNNPNKYFPQIFIADKFTLNNWFLIIREYVDILPDDIRFDYIRLEHEINEWFEDYDEDELMFHKILKLKNSLFLDYLKDNKKDLVNIYNDLINIATYLKNKVRNNIIDIHVDNFGYNGNNLILFDY